MIDNEKVVKGIFLLVFFLIYGGVHLYLFLGAQSSLALGARGSIVLALFMAVMATPLAACVTVLTGVLDTWLDFRKRMMTSGFSGSP